METYKLKVGDYVVDKTSSPRRSYEIEQITSAYGVVLVWRTEKSYFRHNYSIETIERNFLKVHSDDLPFVAGDCFADHKRQRYLTLDRFKSDTFVFKDKEESKFTIAADILLQSIKKDDFTCTKLINLKE